GPQEVRLRPGSYKVVADRDGKRVPLERELVSIAKGGREVVKVKLEAPAAAADAKGEKSVFVLLGGKGEVGKFDTLAEAVQRASDGDTIEVRGNGPFVINPMKLGANALAIRAGMGFRPVVRCVLTGKEQKLFYFLQTSGPLTLEGLEFRY